MSDKTPESPVTITLDVNPNGSLSLPVKPGCEPIEIISPYQEADFMDLYKDYMEAIADRIPAEFGFTWITEKC